MIKNQVHYVIKSFWDSDARKATQSPIDFIVTLLLSWRILAFTMCTAGWSSPAFPRWHRWSCRPALPSWWTRMSASRRCCTSWQCPRSHQRRPRKVRAWTKLAKWRHRWDDSFHLAWSTLTMTSLSTYLLANSSSLGAIILHGPHQVAWKSTRTRRSPAASNLASKSACGWECQEWVNGRS